MNLIVKSSAIALGLLISLGGTIVLVSSAEADTKAPNSSGGSSVKEIDQVISSDTQTYPELMQQAETLATQLINRELQNAAVQTVVVRVSGDRFGSVAPILLVKVSRKDWQAKPNIRDWSRYAGQSSQQLLGYLNPPPPQAPVASSYTPEYVPETAPAVSSGEAAVSNGSGQRRAATSNRAVNPLISGSVPEPSDPGYR
ncbi:hypothetical protein [Phormidesmis sp. 146-33]